MALTDSTFLLDLAVQKIALLTDSNEYYLKVKVTDLFALDLENFDSCTSVRAKHKEKFQPETPLCRQESSIFSLDDKKIKGQTIYLPHKVPYLISKMERNDIVLSIWSKTTADYEIGRCIIPWDKKFIDYLKIVNMSIRLPPVVTNGIYDVVHDGTNTCAGTVTLVIKLICVTKELLKFLSLSKGCLYTYANLFSNPKIILNLNKNVKRCNTNTFGFLRTLPTNKKCLQKRIYKITKPDNIIQTKYKKKVAENDVAIAKENSITHTNIKRPQYIKSDLRKPAQNRVYCVNYFTVDKDGSNNDKSIIESEEQKFTFKECNSECLRKSELSNNRPVYSIDLPQQISSLVKVTRCKEISCGSSDHRKLIQPPDNTVFLDFKNLKSNCCFNELAQKIENVVGNISAKVNYGNAPCYCSCECQFGFTKTTTYCKVCGGYEVVGEDLANKMAYEMPKPCPIFHKLVDKSKLKSWSTSGSESKRKDKDDSQKSIKVGSSQKPSSEKRPETNEKKNVESERESKKDKIKKRDKFKFNYGYKGIPPQIGHSQCAMPCVGTLDNVPKNMGWLWTAENIPGMKFRPTWKPGAVSKQVVRLLRIARNPGEVFGKKKKKETGKKKRNLKRPLLIVHKKDGEFTVTMETMKLFTKPRALNQHPYEDKPVLTYTIGRTDEENRQRRKKKDREQRRLERAQRMFIQSTFKNICHDICMKTYQQALGILPNAEDPTCTCYPAIPTAEVTNMDVSCSCSEDKSTNGSDTDPDEWIVEFTPPNALFDPMFKAKKPVKTDNSSQYTYLDYKVKLADRFGTPVPRYFKGPDGKQQCSDLGGFWGPDHKWLEINVDGFVAPDNKWSPNTFIGPGGDLVDAESGKFQAPNGEWLVVGVDGYIDSQGRWRFYSKHRSLLKQRKQHTSAGVLKSNKIKDEEALLHKSETGWRCFGDASPVELSRLGIFGHGKDKLFLLTRLKDILAHGENIHLPRQISVYNLPNKNKRLHSHINIKKHGNLEYKCHHSLPSNKGIIAINDDGDKTYFRLTNYKNRQPKDRIATLGDHGISLSSFHVPCFSSFINSETLKQKLRDRIFILAAKSAGTQVKYGWKPGAVSCSLLRKLEKAKLMPSVIQATKRLKRNRTLIPNKPTFLFNKGQGVYRIEMQVTAKESAENVSPLVYKITSDKKPKIDNSGKVYRHILNGVGKEQSLHSISDFSPKSNLQAYCTAQGILSNVPISYDTTDCSEYERLSNSYDSSEFECEVHYTPPIALRKAPNKIKTI